MRRFLFHRMAPAIVVAMFLLTPATVEGAAANGQTSPEGASNFMAGLSNEALGVLRADGVSLEEKETRVRKLLANNFDFELIGRFVIGPAWRTASPEQRDAYQELFREFLLRTYSRRLGGYSGQSFEIIGARTVGTRDVLVSTRIMRPNAPPIDAGWRVREDAGSHKILDVVVSGVSMAVTQRSEFRSVISRQGVDGLIETLRAQVSTFSARSR